MSTLSDDQNESAILIAPSILSADFANLEAAITQLEAANADWIHIDVMDGHFVPNLTIGPPVIQSLRKHTRLPFDVHLMIERPELSLERFVDAGADRITVHVEACTHLHLTLQAIRALGIKAGVSLNPATPVHSLEEVLDDVDLILVMSVNPGFGGQQFIPRSLQKIARIRQMIGTRNIHLQVDGGISPATAYAVQSVGATVLVAGNAIFSSSDYALAIEALRHPKSNDPLAMEWNVYPHDPTSC